VNAYCVIANPADELTKGTIEVFDSAGNLKKSANIAIDAKSVIRSWDYIGSIQAIADPALIKVVADSPVVVEAVRWEENKRGWGFAVFPSSIGAGYWFDIPFGSLDNGNVNIGNATGSAGPLLALEIFDMNGTRVGAKGFSLPKDGIVRSWDLLGNIYNFGKPVRVKVSATEVPVDLVADNVKWAGPPYETVGAGFNCGPTDLMKGRTFYFPFSSFGGWANAYCVIANVSGETATVAIEVYDANGAFKKSEIFTLGGAAIARSWDYIGSIQAIADPALIKVTASRDVVVETVRWEQNRRGWGFAVLPAR
jgi:hypothetical protein